MEEARLRQGLNDVFRSLARRSQSLLHRQLTLLDQMERRATDPEALDDLFRLDHLTTRMRRHAEGLVILAGAPPGRGWSSPVRMVDVMRGAIAEVEDYARVSVATRSQAALAGSAVADVIHLLAELIENATTLSPPYTSVRVSGDTVANGFAIEVEDRGLGMSPSRLAELNDRLANPPEFNPSDSEQLGLFVVSQLAKRHGIRVTLKASPYGGTAAIVLIPGHLVVAEEAFRAGLPGDPASVAVAQLTANGNHGVPAELTASGGSGFTEIGSGLPGLAQAPGVRISGPLRRSQGIIPERFDRGAHAAPALGPANGTGGTRSDDLPGRPHDQPGAPAETSLVPNEAGQMPDSGSPSAFDVFMPRRHAQGTGETRGDETPAGADAGPGGASAGAPYPGDGSYIASPSYPPTGSSPYPVPGSGPFPGSGGPSYPGAGRASYPDQPAPFPGWTLHKTPGAAGGRTAPGPASPAGPADSDDAGGLAAAGSVLRPALGSVLRPALGSVLRPALGAARQARAAAWARRTRIGPRCGRTGREQRDQRASAPGQAGQPGSPAPGRPSAAPDHGGQLGPGQRIYGSGEVCRSESGRDPPYHVGASARLAGGPRAAGGRPGIRPLRPGSVRRRRGRRFHHGRGGTWGLPWILMQARPAGSASSTGCSTISCGASGT